MSENRFSIPSPEEHVDSHLTGGYRVDIFVKRDDMIHPVVSGNKWRKLKWNIENAKEQGRDTLLTFGGAHSNHIAATAEAARIFGFKSIGIIRGEDADLRNPTLRTALRNGMKIHRVSRTEFRRNGDRDYIESLRHRFGAFYFIPQGGENHYGVQGCTEIMKELKRHYHRIFVACGTATTLSGMALGNARRSMLTGVSALKGGEFLFETVKHYVSKTFQDEETEREVLKNIEVLTDYHFGGYAKTKSELIEFMRNFYQKTSVKLDPVYTGKTAFAMYDVLKKYKANSNEKWLLIHSGGLQGIEATEAKLGRSIYSNC